MSIYLSLLRGINIGGHKKIKMSDLKALYESLGFGQVTTYIQSGNVLFSAETNEADDILSLRISKAIEDRFGFDVPVVVRTKEEMLQIVAQNPFTAEAEAAPDKLVVMFLGSVPDVTTLEKIKAKITDNSRFAFIGNSLYFFYPDGYGQTKWHSNFFEKQLRTTVTARNWATTCKLAAMVADL
ncbi:DUF1697 domain-containing protein [Paludibacter sp.]|uniref:DUF1697 domain-containing protein n=1 Tax=Paludibacter sp. TaxID=1898105 RepID=UPI0025FA3BEC|nr:DUF1697 domain-containing protein [Paludibacter sp.]